MDGTHPNRKKDKLNPYTLSIENGTYWPDFCGGYIAWCVSQLRQRKPS